MTKPLRVLELRSVRGTGGGPEKTILLGAAHADPQRFAVTVCYLRDQRDPVFAIDTKAASLPIDYVEIRERHSYDPSIWSKLRRLVRERNIDIVHAHDYKTNALTWALAHVERIFPLSTVHGWTGNSRSERLLYYPADKFLLARFPRLIAVSTEIQSTLVQAGARRENISVVLNGIDHRRFRRNAELEEPTRRDYGFATGDIVVGAVGRLEAQKRFDVFIDAVAELMPRHPRLRMLIVGEGSLRSSLEARARAALPPSTCRFAGHRTTSIRTHHALDLFVQSSDYEGTPNAILEAMALETPIIATRAGGTAELVADGVHGLLVPPGDPHALAEGIERALLDPDAARARAALARARVERDLSFDSRMRTVESIYEAVRPVSDDGGGTRGRLRSV